MDDRKISILICSYNKDPYLLDCLYSIEKTCKGFNYDVLLDVEETKSKIEYTPRRYQDLFDHSVGDYIVKSDSDIWYFDGWLEEALEVVDSEKFSYVGVLDHTVVDPLGFYNKFIPMPIYPMKKEYTKPLKFISGACWVFKRELWKKIPYGNIPPTKYLDSAYGYKVVKKLCKFPGYTPNVLCSHMGIKK